MPFKLDIGDPKSKRTIHLETNSDAFIGRKIGETISGSIIKEVPDFKDYEFVITGASDKAGFPALSFVEGTMRKRVLLKRGRGLKRVRKGKKTKKPVRGLRLRRAVRGSVIAEDIAQINLKVSKHGAKSFDEIFGKKEKAEAKEESKEIEKPTEEKKEEKVEEKKE